LKEALYYEKLDGEKVGCHLCPQECVINRGGRGFCGIRKNEKGILYAEAYGKVTAIALDPIEKKPLYHFHPGEYILSVSTKGCNFRCPYCQNWHISQDLKAGTEDLDCEELVNQAKRAGSFGIAYTYNEPLVWYEFVLDASKKAKEAGLENVLVTNGYINEEPLKNLLPFIGAMNVDLKSMDDDFYKEYCKGTLQPVLNTLKTAKKAGVHIEVTNLIIPTINDTEDKIEKLADWVYENLGVETPVHFSRYFPSYRFEYPRTPPETMNMAEEIAKKKLKRVYLGNM
jgi:pyruvate formate lyase activating enzyme